MVMGGTWITLAAHLAPWSDPLAFDTTPIWRYQIRKPASKVGKPKISDGACWWTCKVSWIKALMHATGVSLACVAFSLFKS